MDVRLKAAESPPTSILQLPLRRSLAFRLALLYGVVFAASAAALIGFVYFTTVSALKDQRDRAIISEIGELKSEFNDDGGAADVEKEITKRDSAPAKSQFTYAFFDKDNRLLAGSQMHAPRANGWFDISSATGDPDDQLHMIHLRTALLPGGYLLAIGEDADQVDDLREFLAAALIVGMSAALVLALAGGAVLSWAFRRRLDRVAAVCREIITGKLSLRVPAGRSGDEIDLLATSVNAMLDRIVGLMDTLRQVSTDVAHDLRTPLARLRQGLEATKFKAKTTDDYAAAVDKAIGEVDTLLETFAALLRIAELEAGTRRSAFKPVDASLLFQTVADAYTPPAEENGQRIVAKIDPGVVVTGDGSLLTQMIANLVANALRHSPRGATVSIALTGSGDHPTAVIADDGPGIPEDDRPRVFQPFVRLERSRTTPGSGLGLSLCAAIAELHGVRLDLKDNHPGLRCELTF